MADHMFICTETFKRQPRSNFTITL